MRLGLVAFLILIASYGSANAADHTLDIRSNAKALAPKIEKSDYLSPAARQLAEQLGILDNIEKLGQTKNTSASELDVLRNRQIILQIIMTAMLEVRATSAEIAYEIFEAGQVQNYLADRRDKQLKANSIANFVSGGVSEALGGAFQLSPRINIGRIGNIMEIVGGGAEMGLSTIGLRQAAGEKKVVVQTGNMLLPIFDTKAETNAKFPENVWRYLNSTPPNEMQTRRELLMKEWLRFARLRSKDKNILAALAGSGNTNMRLSIALLEDRQAMLSDLDALVLQMDKHLLEIMMFTNKIQPTEDAN